MKSYKLAVVLLSLGLTVAGTAHAASIDYIFTGTFDGTLGSTSYTNQAFSVTLTGDTTAVTSGGDEFNNIPSSTTFTIGSTSGSFGGNFNEVAINSPFNTIGFEQSNSVSGFAVEALSSSALTGYALDTAFPQTSGTLSTAPATYVINQSIDKPTLCA